MIVKWDLRRHRKARAGLHDASEARVVRALRAPAEPGETAGLAQALDTFRRERAAAPHRGRTPRRRQTTDRRHVERLAGIMIAVTGVVAVSLGSALFIALLNRPDATPVQPPGSDTVVRTEQGGTTRTTTPGPAGRPRTRSSEFDRSGLPVRTDAGSRSESSGGRPDGVGLGEDGEGKPGKDDQATTTTPPESTTTATPEVRPTLPDPAADKVPWAR